MRSGKATRLSVATPPKYGWAGGSRFKLDAQAAGEHLEALRKTKGGELTPEDVFEDAKRPKSPLHSAFVWDGKEAIKQFGLVRAREILRFLTIEIESVESPVRHFVVVDGPPDEDDGSSSRFFTSVTEALADPDMRQQVLERALGELRAFKKKYARLQELAGVFVEAQKAERRIKQKRA